MRSSTILAFAVAAVAGPAFAVPIAAPAESSEVEPGTALNSGAISTFTRFVAPLIGIMNFKNSQRREALENLLARAEDSDDESGAGRRLDNAANIADIGSSLISAWQSLRGREDLFARAEDGDDESGAGRRLDNAANIADIGSSLISAWQSLRGREDLFARAEDGDDESGAGRRLDNAASIAGIGSSLLSAWQSLRAREDDVLARRDTLEDLFARADDVEDESGAGRRLDNAANIAGIGSSLLSAWQSLRAREDDVLLARDIEELLARSGPNRPSSGRPLLVPVGPHPKPVPRSFDDDAFLARSMNELD